MRASDLLHHPGHAHISNFPVWYNRTISLPPSHGRSTPMRMHTTSTPSLSIRTRKPTFPQTISASTCGILASATRASVRPRSSYYNRVTNHLVTSDIVDIKPVNMEELTEVITAAEFHPQHCNLFMYSSSKSNIKLADMRDSALCDRHAKCASL